MCVCVHVWHICMCVSMYVLDACAHISICCMHSVCACHAHWILTVQWHIHMYLRNSIAWKSGTCPYMHVYVCISCMKNNVVCRHVCISICVYLFVHMCAVYIYKSSAFVEHCTFNSLHRCIDHIRWQWYHFEQHFEMTLKQGKLLQKVVCVCVCVCIIEWKRVLLLFFSCVLPNIDARVHVCLCTCMHVYVYVYMHTWKCVCRTQYWMWKCVHAHSWIFPFHMHICTHAYMYPHLSNSLSWLHPNIHSIHPNVEKRLKVCCYFQNSKQ